MAIFRKQDGYSTALSVNQQELANAIWEEIMNACEDYFLRGITEWASDSSAPEFPEELIRKQVESWDDYRNDRGAMIWKHNDTKDFAYDLTKLPIQMQRVLCERAYALSKAAGLFDDPDWVKRAKDRRKDAELT